MMESNYAKVIDGDLCISKTFLIDLGFDRNLLNKKIRVSKKKGLNFYLLKKSKGSNNIYIQYNTLPFEVVDSLNIPRDSDELLRDIADSLPLENKAHKSLQFALRNVWLYPNYWTRYIPLYKEFFTNASVIDNHARTHAVLAEVILIKKSKAFKMAELHSAYQELSKVTFKTSDYKYFCHKISKCDKEGIQKHLVHDYRIYGRKPYKITSEIKSIIQSYRLNSKLFSNSKILELINTELLNKGLGSLSQTSVNRIINDLEFRNKTDIIRFGKKYAQDNIEPFISRNTPKLAGDLYEIDSTQINIYYNRNGSPSYLNLTAIIDVHSRKIVGYNMDESENFSSVECAIKSSFESEKIIPKNILVDNHKLYHSEDFKMLKNKLKSYGVDVRHSRVGNAKDKAHIERWFGTFQTKYLSNIKGFLGEGIKSKRLGARVSQEKSTEFYKKKNLYEKDNLKELIAGEIHNYNNSVHNVTKEEPIILFKQSSRENNNKFNKFDIQFLFGLSKIITVRKSKIQITHKGNEYTYTIYDRKIANKINRSSVKIFYSDYDLSNIYVSNLNNEFITILPTDSRINQIPLTEEDSRAYSSHYAKIKSNTRKNLKEVYKEIKSSTERGKLIDLLGVDESLNNQIKLIKEESKDDFENELMKLNVIKKKSVSPIYIGDLKKFKIEDAKDKDEPFKLKRIK